MGRSSRLAKIARRPKDHVGDSTGPDGARVASNYGRLFSSPAGGGGAGGSNLGRSLGRNLGRSSADG